MSLIDTLEQLCQQEEIEYNKEALEKMLAVWENNKTPLMDILRKHPNWDEEKKMVIFKMDYERTINICAARDFYSWAYGCEISQDWEVISKWRSAIGWLHDHISVELTEKQAEEINKFDPILKVRAGQKTTRVINKLLKKVGLDKKENFNQKFAAFCDAISPMAIKKYTCISVNPIDYLLMSHGNSWTSCHTVKKYEGKDVRGGHCSGTLSYMLDNSSFVYYTVDNSYNGNSIEFQPKIERQIFAYGEDKLLQSRLYPKNGGDSDIYANIRSIVQKIITDCLEVPNFWTKYDTEEGAWSDFITHGDYYTHYPDYEYNSYCNVTRLKDSLNVKNMIVGHAPICFLCGREHGSECDLFCRCRE